MAAQETLTNWSDLPIDTKVELADQLIDFIGDQLADQLFADDNAELISDQAVYVDPFTSGDFGQI